MEIYPFGKELEVYSRIAGEFGLLPEKGFTKEKDEKGSEKWVKDDIAVYLNLDHSIINDPIEAAVYITKKDGNEEYIDKALNPVGLFDILRDIGAFGTCTVKVSIEATMEVTGAEEPDSCKRVAKNIAGVVLKGNGFDDIEFNEVEITDVKKYESGSYEPQET